MRKEIQRLIQQNLNIFVVGLQEHILSLKIWMQVWVQWSHWLQYLIDKFSITRTRNEIYWIFPTSFHLTRTIQTLLKLGIDSNAIQNITFRTMETATASCTKAEESQATIQESKLSETNGSNQDYKDDIAIYFIHISINPFIPR